MSSEAVAPVIISTSSPVMTAWRVRLYKIWYLPIISPAFLEAFCGIFVSKHVQRIIRSVSVKTYVHGIATGRLLAGVALGKSPIQGVGKAVLAEVGEDVVVSLESGNVG